MKDVCVVWMLFRGVYEPPSGHISAECKDLIKQMLTVDAAQRYTMEEILRHPWCRDSLDHATSGLGESRAGADAGLAGHLLEAHCSRVSIVLYHLLDDLSRGLRVSFAAF